MYEKLVWPYFAPRFVFALAVVAAAAAAAAAAAHPGTSFRLYASARVCSRHMVHAFCVTLTRRIKYGDGMICDSRPASSFLTIRFASMLDVWGGTSLQNFFFFLSKSHGFNLPF